MARTRACARARAGGSGCFCYGLRSDGCGTRAIPRVERVERCYGIRSRGCGARARVKSTECCSGIQSHARGVRALALTREDLAACGYRHPVARVRRACARAWCEWTRLNVAMASSHMRAACVRSRSRGQTRLNVATPSCRMRALMLVRAGPAQVVTASGARMQRACARACRMKPSECCKCTRSHGHGTRALARARVELRVATASGRVGTACVSPR